MRNTRLPVSLNDTTCTITDTASSTNRPPMMASATSCLVATATEPISPPMASEPRARRPLHPALAEGAGVAHEDRGWRRVEPEKAQARTDHGAAQHRELAGAG